MRGLRTELAAAHGPRSGSTAGPLPSEAPSRPRVHESASSAGYSEVQARLPEVVRDATPFGATVLVVSKGDEQLRAHRWPHGLALPARSGRALRRVLPGDRRRCRRPSRGAA